MAEFNNLFDLVRKISKGVFSNHCDDLLREAVEYLEENENGKAEITLKLTLTQKGDHIITNPEATLKLPKRRFNQSFHFFDHGTLSTEDPNQKKMNFDAPTGDNVTSIKN